MVLVGLHQLKNNKTPAQKEKTQYDFEIFENLRTAGICNCLRTSETMKELLQRLGLLVRPMVLKRKKTQSFEQVAHISGAIYALVPRISSLPQLKIGGLLVPMASGFVSFVLVFVLYAFYVLMMYLLHVLASCFCCDPSCSLLSLLTIFVHRFLSLKNQFPATQESHESLQP